MRATALFSLAALVTTGLSIPYAQEGPRQQPPPGPLIDPSLPTQFAIHEAMEQNIHCGIGCMFGAVRINNFLNLPKLFEQCMRSTKCGGGELPPGSGTVASAPGRRQKQWGHSTPQGAMPMGQVMASMQRVLDERGDQLQQIMSSMGPAGPVVASIVVVALVAVAFPALAAPLSAAAGAMRLGWVLRAAPMLAAA